MAFALAAETKQHGLKCDTQCMIDTVRVLRIPHTFNCKSDPPLGGVNWRPGRDPSHIGYNNSNIGRWIEKAGLWSAPPVTTLPSLKRECSRRVAASHEGSRFGRRFTRLISLPSVPVYSLPQ